MRLTNALFVFVAVALFGLARTAEGESLAFGPPIPVPGLTQGQNISYVNPDATRMLLANDAQIWRRDFDSGTGQWLPRVSMGFPAWATCPTVAPPGGAFAGDLFYSQHDPGAGSTKVYRSPGPPWSWSPGSPVSINNQPQYAHVTSFDGHDLYLNDNYNGIMVSHWDGTGFQAANRLFPDWTSRNASAWAWDSPGGGSMIFAADRPEGYGSLDLYSMQWGTDSWDLNTIKNLGSSVNTPDEESGPTYAYDAHRLYFMRFPAQGGLGQAMQADVGVGVVPLPSVAWSVLGLLGCLIAIKRLRTA